MKAGARLTEANLNDLRKIDSCMTANAVESSDLRLRNAGFTDGSVHCMFPDLPPTVGYAVTARLRSGEAPIRGATFHDRTDLWNSILEVPAPRVLVLQDMDHPAGRGAFLGDVHTSILKALGCVGYVTNGAVRELPRIRAMGFQLFAGSVVVSHAYAHIFEVGAKITVGGLDVSPGTLLHGDQHGLLNVPLEIAASVPEVAEKMRQREQKVIEFCRSNSFSVAKLSELIKTLS
jgi:4-hydroxy-4-methyl-2-oxoglutarate aldolase